MAEHLDQASLKSLAKAQRPVLSQLEEEERKPSLATDEKVQSILERPVWSLQHMRQKVKLLPLPDPSYLKHQEWMWDDNKPIPKSSVREAPMRDWRSSFFEQIKCDSKLRIEKKKSLKPVHAGVQKREAWGRYKNERKHIFETQLKKDAERHATIQRDIQELEKAAKQIEDLEEKKRAALGLL